MGPRRLLWFQEQPCLGLGMSAACFILALVPSLMASPNTINEICELPPPTGLALTLTFAWSCHLAFYIYIDIDIVIVYQLVAEKAGGGSFSIL